MGFFTNSKHDHGVLSGIRTRDGSGNGRHGGSNIPKGGRAPSKAEQREHDRKMGR